MLWAAEPCTSVFCCHPTRFDKVGERRLMSTSDFPWAEVPPADRACELHVFKDRCKVDTHKCDRAISIVGRADTCHVLLAHESISRRHAAIVHADDGAFLVDLGSTHGTFYDGERLRPHKRILIKPGGTFSFGASTRKFLLAGRGDAGELAAESAAAWAERMANKKAGQKSSDDAAPVADGDGDADGGDAARKRKTLENRAANERKKLARKEKWVSEALVSSTTAGADLVL